MKVYIKFLPADTLDIRLGLLKDKISRLGRIEIFIYTLHQKDSVDEFPAGVITGNLFFESALSTAEFISITYFLHVRS